MRAQFVYDPNADIEERCQIYLGRKEGTKLYSRGVLNWFHNIVDWVNAAKPSDEEIRAELADFLERDNRWVADANSADCWDGYYIDKFQKFLPEIEWVKGYLTTVPLDSK